jgi:hypothetical protein
MKRLYAGILALALATNAAAESSQASHQVNINIQPYIILAVDDNDRVQFVNTIAGSLEHIALSDVRVMKGNQTIPMNSTIEAYFYMLSQSDYINWNKTGVQFVPAEFYQDTITITDRN